VTPLISVVIPSHRGAARLPATLAALGRQVLEPSQFEVIVVLDGPDPDARAALAGLAVPFKMIVVEQTQAGAAAARNRGAGHACSPLLLFLDDDMTASPGLLAAHLEGQAMYPGSVLLGYFHQPRESDAVDLLADGADHWWAARFDALGRPGHVFSFKDLCAGNFSVPRRAFEASGGFAAYFAGAAGEDYELGIRLFRAGVPFHYLPAAKSAHRYRAALDRTLGRARAEGIGDVRIARHHPDAFPSLLLARAAPATASGARSWVPWAPAWFLAAAPAVLAPAWRLVAALKLRRSARGLQSFMRYCAYWRGARREAGSAAALEKLVREGLAAAQQAPAAAWMPPLDETLDVRDTYVRAAKHGDWRVPERTFVGDYDVAGPVTSYSGSLDYGHALILVRDAGAPVGVLKLDKPRGIAIDRAAVDAALREPAWIATLARRRLLAAHAAPRYDCPPISVVVCTRDRAESLRHCLASLRALDYPAYEIIVVDNASCSAETRAAAEAAGWTGRGTAATGRRSTTSLPTPTMTSKWIGVGCGRSPPASARPACSASPAWCCLASSRRVPSTCSRSTARTA
jgi:glycosyltransferase involved in cell wall biosynthesis